MMLYFNEYIQNWWFYHENSLTFTTNKRIAFISGGGGHDPKYDIGAECRFCYFPFLPCTILQLNYPGFCDPQPHYGWIHTYTYMTISIMISYNWNHRILLIYHLFVYMSRSRQVVCTALHFSQTANGRCWTEKATKGKISLLI